MDQSAIHAISQLSVDAAKANLLETDTPAIVLSAANGTQTLASIEYLQPGRSRFRGAYETNGLLAFAEHVLAQAAASGASQAQTFIDPNAVSAKTYFNLGDHEHPGHGDHTATLNLMPTAAYAALLAIAGRPLSQAWLHDFVEDWRDIIVPVYGATADSSRISSALAAIRNITIETARKVNLAEGDFSQSRSAMESIDARSDHELPSRFVLTTVPYEGLPSRAFHLRLSVMTGGAGEKLSLVLRIQQAEQVSEDIANDFRQQLIDRIGDASVLFIGTFNP